MVALWCFWSYLLPVCSIWWISVLVVVFHLLTLLNNYICYISFFTWFLWKISTSTFFCIDLDSFTNNDCRKPYSFGIRMFKYLGNLVGYFPPPQPFCSTTKGFSHLFLSLYFLNRLLLLYSKRLGSVRVDYMVVIWRHTTCFIIFFFSNDIGTLIAKGLYCFEDICRFKLKKAVYLICL